MTTEKIYRIEGTIIRFDRHQIQTPEMMDAIRRGIHACEYLIYQEPELVSGVALEGINNSLFGLYDGYLYWEKYRQAQDLMNKTRHILIAADNSYRIFKAFSTVLQLLKPEADDIAQLDELTR